MTVAFLIIAFLTLASAALAMSLRNLIHSALLLVVSWAGIAAFYLWAGAEFVAFAQVLVYVGAVSMIVLFAVLLTRGSKIELAIAPASWARAAGALVAGGAVLGVLFGAVLGTPLPTQAKAAAVAPVKQIGAQLMTAHLAGVLIVGLILTVALIGAIVLAAGDRTETRPEENP